MDIEGAWKSACKILLGEEVGSMNEYGAYLKRHVKQVHMTPSAFSGKAIAFASPHICKNAKAMDYEEIVEYSMHLAKTPLKIDEIKDMDSLMGALREWSYYAGNIVLGNSADVESVDRCHNSSHIAHSVEVYDSKYVAYSSTLRYAEYVFGSDAVGQGTRFCIKGYDVYQLVRGFESIRVFNSSDCYYSGNLEGCSNCLFSFNLRKANYCIGNLPLPRERYAELRKKLVEDIRETLKSKKSVPSVMEIMGGADEGSG